MTRDNLNVIINVAASDHHIEDKEERVIRMLGTASGFSKEDLDEMLQNPEPIDNLSVCSDSERFETLYHLIQIMKADGKVFKSEISFCESMATKLGYKKGVIANLSAYIYADLTVTADRDMLLKKANKFLK